jgi:hypothetical protein
MIICFEALHSTLYLRLSILGLIHSSAHCTKCPCPQSIKHLNLTTFNPAWAMFDPCLVTGVPSLLKHRDRAHVIQGTQQPIRSAGIVVHHLKQVLKLASIFNRELSQGVHVQQIVVDL